MLIQQYIKHVNASKHFPYDERIYECKKWLFKLINKIKIQWTIDQVWWGGNNAATSSRNEKQFVWIKFILNKLWNFDAIHILNYQAQRFVQKLEINFFKNLVFQQKNKLKILRQLKSQNLTIISLKTNL